MKLVAEVHFEQIHREETSALLLPADTSHRSRSERRTQVNARNQTAGARQMYGDATGATGSIEHGVAATQMKRPTEEGCLLRAHGVRLEP